VDERDRCRKQISQLQAAVEAAKIRTQQLESKVQEAQDDRNELYVKAREKVERFRAV
jgi:FtsZ-binding cell division protein ZapB